MSYRTIVKNAHYMYICKVMVKHSNFRHPLFSFFYCHCFIPPGERTLDDDRPLNETTDTVCVPDSSIESSDSDDLPGLSECRNVSSSVSIQL